MKTHLYTCLLSANRLFKEAPQGVKVYSGISFWEKEKAEGQDQPERELRSPERFHRVLRRPPYRTGWSVMSSTTPGPGLLGCELTLARLYLNLDLKSSPCDLFAPLPTRASLAKSPFLAFRFVLPLWIGLLRTAAKPGLGEAARSQTSALPTPVYRPCYHLHSRNPQSSA